MKLFRTIDQKFADIGFHKITENENCVLYKRKRRNPYFTQSLVLLYKSNGRHIIQSYDASLSDKRGIGHTCVGITPYEAKLCIKKMNSLGWKVPMDKNWIR